MELETQQNLPLEYPDRKLTNEEIVSVLRPIMEQMKAEIDKENS